MSETTMWVAIFTLVFTIMGIGLGIYRHLKEKRNKEINFLYKRMREFKNWCNEYTQTLIEHNNLIKSSLGITARRLSQSTVKYIDITNAQVYFTETILTSKVLKYKQIFSEHPDWVNIKKTVSYRLHLLTYWMILDQNFLK